MRIQSVFRKSYTHTVNMKKRSERPKHCALAVVRQSQNFSPRRRPTSWRRRTAQDDQSLISWRWSYLYLQTQFG